MTAPARKAQFDAAARPRRGLLAKVHIGQKALGLDGDDYVALLVRITGRSSAGDCSEAELAQVVREMERLGFRPAPAGSGGKRKASPADHAPARKARALWISLGHLNAIDDVSEAALEAFARRQLGVAQLQWADQAMCYKLVEALKAIALRHGWQQKVSAALAPADRVIMLKRNLVHAILAKLVAAGLIPAGWDAVRAARELGGITIDDSWFALNAEQLDALARALGARLRDPAGHLKGER